MMENVSYRSLMVVGENPATLLDIYDMNKKVEPYVKYKYSDAKKLKELAISSLSELLANADKFELTKFQRDYFTDKLKTTKATSDLDYFINLTNGLDYDKDGNAITTENPNGKWKKCRLGCDFSTPFVKTNGESSFQAKKGEIEWEFIHMRKKRVQLFSGLWDVIKEGKEPSSDKERNIAELWQDNKNYLDNFETKEELITHSCMYWNYAVVNENGWFSMDDDGMTDRLWIATFYDKFISGLSDDTLLSIYEFSVV